MKKNNLIKKVKQTTAGLLTAAMVLTGAPLGSMSAWASVLQPNTDLQVASDSVGLVSGTTYGSSDTTSYAFGNATGKRGSDSSPSGNVSSFDLAGIVKEADRANANKGYSSTLKTGYGNSWWQSYYAFGKPKYIANSDGSGDASFRLYDANSTIDKTGTYDATTGQPDSINGNFVSGNIKDLWPDTNTKNGSVKELTDPNGNKIELRQEVKPSDDNQYILVQYTALNLSNNTVDFMVGNETDTELGNLDAVPIFVTSHGNANAKFEGLHFDSNGWTGSGSGSGSGKNYKSFAIFDIYSTLKGANGQIAGMQKRDNNDPSETRVRAGTWSNELLPGGTPTPGNPSPSPLGGSHRLWVFSQSKPGYINPGDSAAAFSAYFNLNPHEQKIATFAIAIKPMVMYVNPASPLVNGNTNTWTDPNYSAGFMGSPINSVEEAVKRIKNLLDDGSNIAKAYIYLQSDVVIDHAIEIPAGLDITIQSADFLPSTGGNAYIWTLNTPQVNENRFTVKRAPNYKEGPLFRVSTANTTNPSTASSRLTFLNVNVSGENIADTEAPLIEANIGKVTVKQDVNISGNTVKEGASVISLKGGATLDLNAKGGDVNITGNNSVKNGSAIVIDSSITNPYPITLNGNIKVTGNTVGTGTDSKPANIDIGTKMLYVEKGNEFTGKVGINTTNTPKADNQGTPIIDFEGNTPTAVEPYTTANFTSDTDGQNIEEANTSNKETNANISAATAQIANRIYLTAPFKTITISYVDKDGSNIGVNLAGATADPNKFAVGTINPVITNMAVGSKIGTHYTYTIPVPPGSPTGTTPTVKEGWYIKAPELAGYIIDKVTFNPDYSESGKTRTIGTTTIPGTINEKTTTTEPSDHDKLKLGYISGTVYRDDVDIQVEYVKAGKTYKFDTRGGNTIVDKYESLDSSNPTSQLGALPTPVKNGYQFDGWVRYNDANNNGKYDTGEQDSGTMATADPSVSITLGDFTSYLQRTGKPETVMLYAKWSPGSTLYDVTRKYINSNPSLSLNFGSDVSHYQITHVVDHDPVYVPGYKYSSGFRIPSTVGTLDTPTQGHLHIDSMPAQNIMVTYRYVMDPTKSFTYTVKYVDASGNDIGSAPAPVQRRVEQPINAQKQNITGYTYDSMTLTVTPDPSDAALGLPADRFISLSGNMVTTNDSTNGNFVGYMPNQNVTVTFHYSVDAGMNLVRRYLDHERNDSMITSKVNGPYTPGDALNAADFTFAITDELYGYVYGTHTLDNLDPAGSGSVAVDATGNITGNMPSAGNGVIVKYLLNHDANKWRTINFAVANTPNNSGSVDPLPAGAPTSFLANDGTAAGNTHAYTFDKLKTEGYVPDVTPNRYYKFDGWYKDAAATQQVNGTDTFPTVSPNAPLTLYAKFVEDPSQWFDINFAAGSNGSISAPATIHVPYDYTWSQVAALPSALLPTAQLPTATPVANFLFNGWKDPNGAFMQPTSTLTNHATYTAFFSQDPNVFGGIGSITPTGHIDSDGSGLIRINGTTPGNVYVISDPDGNIVAVVPGNGTGSITNVPGLTPGAHYNVQEGTPDTVATVGQPISSITGTSVSTPRDVFIPTVEDNYNIGYDPQNPGMAQIVVNPADPDADYALIDENGNVVPYPGSDNGWMTPVGNNPSTVTFNNLNPNETYTVVARKKGNTAIPNPLTKLSDGTQIVANPGDMANAPKYIVEVKDNDPTPSAVEVVTVGTTNVNAPVYSEAKAGEEVTVHANPVDANGKNFLYWQVLAGRAVGLSGRITTNDLTFKLSNSNIVLKAVYEVNKIATDDGDLTEEIRGGAQGEFGLVPSQIPSLINGLTTPLDRSLISVNGATVEYRVVFNKRNATDTEAAAAKAVSDSGIDHPDAYTAAYALDIKQERYVNGRRVDDPSATPSNATIDVVAQLPANDTDQLDYQLFDMTSGTPVEVTSFNKNDVPDNAGLITFTGNLNHSYVLVYSKIFYVTFIDNKPVFDYQHLNDATRNFYKRFKVRRKENVEDSYYSLDYGVVTNYAQNDVPGTITTPFEDIYGVQYDYVNWSKKEDSISVYDTTSPVTKAIIIYAGYKDNKPKVTGARKTLGNTIDEAKDIMMDPYLKVGEAAELQEAINKAIDTLNWARGILDANGIDHGRMANYAELQQQIDALRRLIDRYRAVIDGRMGDRDRRTGGASGGGNSSSGRGSKLLTPGEKSQQSTARNEGSNVRAFVLGVDGAWEVNPVTKGWSFVLNGGTPINDMWGMITFDDNTGKKVSRWYYFDGQSTMATGWVYDSKNGNWYYMNTNEGPDLGQMVTGWVKDPKTSKWYYMNDNTGILVTGWHLDKQDGRWYYLNQNGEMLTGWQNIGGKWYYFNTNTPQNTYAWDAAAFKWNYLNNNVRPYGSMYAGEKTPDGYTVDANGAWN